MKNIVVPIDFSQDSLNALEHAIIIANKANADITMLHVKKKKSFYADKVDFDSKYSDDDDQYISFFDKIVDSVKNRLHTFIDYKLREGKTYQEIINLSRFMDAYMIVMGTHGISGFEERWIGSNAYKVVSDAPCPVITMRMDYLNLGFNTILAPIDHTDETRQKLPILAQFAKMFDAEIIIAGLYESNKDATKEKIRQYMEQAELYLKTNDLKFRTEELSGRNLADMVIEYALSAGVQLIGAMTEQSESSLNLWLGNNAQQLVNHSPIPVMSIQPF
jgi:nucleotide-binding universal stress UspA family protein